MGNKKTKIIIKSKENILFKKAEEQIGHNIFVGEIEYIIYELKKNFWNNEDIGTLLEILRIIAIYSDDFCRAREILNIMIELKLCDKKINDLNKYNIYSRFNIGKFKV